MMSASIALRVSVTDDLDTRARETARRPWTESAPRPPEAPLPDEDKWPAWMVTFFVLAFCGSFWAALAMVVMLIA